MTTATDNFNRADTGTLGANWTKQTTWEFQIISNQAASNGGFNPVSEYWNAGTFSGDHSSEAAISGMVSGNTYVGVAVRCSTSAETYYALKTDGASGITGGGGHTRIVKVVAGAETALLDIDCPFADGDVIKLAIAGTTLTAYKNGASVGTTTDSSLSGGKPGLFVYGNAARVDNWTGADIDTTVYDPITACFPIGYYE